jgi:Fic family protein
MGRDGAASSPPWPRVEFEERAWIPTADPSLVSRAIRVRHAGPYRAAVPPRIAKGSLNLPSRTVAVADEASTAITRFDLETGSELIAFGAIMLRSESASSSMIENLTSGAKAIAVAELSGQGKRNASEIVDNVHAMQAAVEPAGDLTESTVLAMHRTLMDRLHPAMAGRWRSQQVWIGGDGFGPHGATFVAPHHENVPAAMADLLQFARRDDLPVLAHAAVTHAQFETIHPFADGNGRTGRAMLHAMLRSRELVRNVTVPISAGLLTDPGRYFDALTSYRDGDPSAIVERIAEASLLSVANGRQLADDIAHIRRTWHDSIRTRRDAAAWRLADLMLRRPVVDADLVARELKIPAYSARTAIDRLVDAGVLTEFTGLRRNRMWQSREILDALDAFADRAGRHRNVND